MALLRVVAILQAICLLPILIRFLILPPDFGAVGLWFFAIGVSVLTLPYSLWQLARHPERRSLAAMMLTLAVLTIGTPMLMAHLELNSLPLPVAGLAAVVLGLLVSGWLLARPGFWSADGWAAGRFNAVLLTLLLIWIVLVAFPLVHGLLFGFTPPLSDSRQAMPIDAWLIHAASVGAAGVLLAVFALFFSVIGLWRQREYAWMHGGQLMAALVLAGLLAIQAAILSILLVNPG